MAEKAPGNIIETIKQWPRRRQISLAVVVLLSLVFFGLIVFQARNVDYQLLFGNMATEDASAVVTRLKEQKIPYRLEDGGKAIYIPADRVYETRLELAGSGLPQGGGVGFEIFDKQSFGMTDFAQKINYQRALQGELARTIASLAPVEAARVHLAMAEKRLFREQQEKTTASVIIKLVPGRKLSENQIQGIINLVAGSVEGLDNPQVSVIDSNGRVLSKPRDTAVDSPLAPGLLEYQRSFEKSLEQRAQALLDRAVGTGNSLVQVTASLDFSQRERMEETYDPNATAVRSEQVTSEKSGSGISGGIPGVQSNLKGSEGSAGSTSSNRTEETTNYEVSKVVSKLIEPVGAIKNLSVAVLVADKLTPAEGKEQPTYQPRTEQELGAIEKMVRSALGLQDGRGDQIVVISRPFEKEFYGVSDPVASPANKLYPYLPLIKYGLLSAGVLLLYFLFIRPLIQTLKGQGKMVEHYKTVEQLESELTGQPLQLESPDAETMKLRKDIFKEEDIPAQIIKSWLKDS
jgi:flagellar M-ring protein FliF